MEEELKVTYLAMSFGAVMYKPFYDEMRKRFDFQWLLTFPHLNRHYCYHGFEPVVVDPQPRKSVLARLDDRELLTRLGKLRERFMLPSLRPLFWSSSAYASQTIYARYPERDLWIHLLGIAEALEEYLEVQRPEFVIQQFGAEIDRRILRMLCDERGIDTVFLNYIPYYQGFQPSMNEVSHSYGMKLHSVGRTEVQTYLEKIRAGEQCYFLEGVSLESSLVDKVRRFASDPDRVSLLAGYFAGAARSQYQGLRKAIVDTVGRLFLRDLPAGRRIVLFPIQTPSESNVTVASRGFYDQSLVIRHLALDLPEDCILCVKFHPHYVAGNQLKQFLSLGKIPGVYFAGPTESLRKLLERVSAVVTINSTVGFDALAMRVPVISLGESIYRGRGATIDVDSLGELPRAIGESLRARVSDEAVEVMVTEWFEQALRGWFDCRSDMLADDLLRFCEIRLEQRRGTNRKKGRVADPVVGSRPMAPCSQADDPKADGSQRETRD